MFHHLGVAQSGSVALVQLAEHHIVNVGSMGSYPIGHPQAHYVYNARLVRRSHQRGSDAPMKWWKGTPHVKQRNAQVKDVAEGCSPRKKKKHSFE